MSTALACALADVGGLLRCHAWTGVSPAQPGGSRAVLPWLALAQPALRGLWLTSSYYLRYNYEGGRHQPTSFFLRRRRPVRATEPVFVTPLAGTSLVRFSCDADSPVVFGLSAPQYAIKTGERGFPCLPCFFPIQPCAMIAPHLTVEWITDFMGKSLSFRCVSTTKTHGCRRHRLQRQLSQVYGTGPHRIPGAQAASNRMSCCRRGSCLW